MGEKEEDSKVGEETEEDSSIEEEEKEEARTAEGENAVPERHHRGNQNYSSALGSTQERNFPRRRQVSLLTDIQIESRCPRKPIFCGEKSRWIGHESKSSSVLHKDSNLEGM